MPSRMKRGFHLAAFAVLFVVGLVAGALVPVTSVSAAPASTTLAVQYLHSDLLGSVRLASSSTGVIVSTTRFDEFGARTAHTGERIATNGGSQLTRADSAGDETAGKVF